MRSMYFTYFLFCCLLVSFLFVPNAETDEKSAEELSETKTDMSGMSPEDSEQDSNDFGGLDLSELSEPDKQYLGIKAGVKPVLSNVDADTIIVEFLNVYCPGCQEQAPILNQIHSAIGSDPVLKSRVRMLGIAVGNNCQEVEDFRKEKEVPFPILTDPEFIIHESLADSMRTPYTVILRRDETGNFIVVNIYTELTNPYSSYLDEIKAAMEYDDDTLKSKQEKASLDNVVEQNESSLSEEELMVKIKDIMAAVSRDKDISICKRLVSLPDSPEVYEGQSEHGRYFAIFVNKISVCNVCHGAQFIYVIDGAGKVVHFEPIFLTKHGNNVWDETDIEKTRKRVLGRSISQPTSFNPEVDAVTSATITSAIIFKAIADGKNIYQLIK